MAHLVERFPETLMSVIFSLDWIHHDFFCVLDLLVDPIYTDFLVKLMLNMGFEPTPSS